MSSFFLDFAFKAKSKVTIRMIFTTLKGVCYPIFYIPDELSAETQFYLLEVMLSHKVNAYFDVKFSDFS